MPKFTEHSLIELEKFTRISVQTNNLLVIKCFLIVICSICVAGYQFINNYV